MIARLWHGMTPKSKADEYVDYLNQTGVRDYQAVECNLGVHVLRRIEDEQAHFLILTFWDSIEAIKKLQVKTSKKPAITLKTGNISWSLKSRLRITK